MDRLKVMTVRIKYEGCVVVRVVVRAERGLPVRATPNCESNLEKLMDCSA